MASRILAGIEPDDEPKALVLALRTENGQQRVTARLSKAGAVALAGALSECALRGAEAELTIRGELELETT